MGDSCVCSVPGVPLSSCMELGFQWLQPLLDLLGPLSPQGQLGLYRRGRPLQEGKRGGREAPESWGGLRGRERLAWESDRGDPACLCPGFIHAAVTAVGCIFLEGRERSCFGSP